MIILGENTYFDNRYKANANNILIGSPGTGKTRSFVLPNLMNANDESLVVLDPKGEVYDMTASLMYSKGYKIRSLDFIYPQKSTVHYNPLAYCHNEDDIVKLSALLVRDQKTHTSDAFWPLTAQILCNALTSYLLSYRPVQQQNLGSLLVLLRAASVKEDNPETHDSKLDLVFKEVEEKDPKSWALSQYSLVKKAAGKTQKSILISLIAEFCGLLTPHITALTSYNDIDLEDFCREKTILYIKCSDTDRSKDKLIALFFMQLFQELYRLADASPFHTLQRPVHVILDDLGANLKIPNLDGIISTSRGRSISLSIILQSIGQLKKNYTDYTSILNSCNNMVFLGGNDIETCQEMSLRLNKPLSEVLYKETDTIYVFRQGRKPVVTKAYDVRRHPAYKKLNDHWNEGPCAMKKEEFDGECERQ